MIWQALTDRGLLFLTALQKLEVLDLSYTGEFVYRRLELMRSADSQTAEGITVLQLFNPK